MDTQNTHDRYTEISNLIVGVNFQEINIAKISNILLREGEVGRFIQH